MFKLNFSIGVREDNNLLNTSPNCCFIEVVFFSTPVDLGLKMLWIVVVCSLAPAQTNDVCVLLIWGFIESPLEINRGRAHATSKHQSRLKCRWTLCPFITHALNHLAVISLATGEGIRGHLTSCSLSPLWQMAKHIYFSQSILPAIPPLLNALYRSSFLVLDLCVCVFPLSLSHTHLHTGPHVHIRLCVRMGSGCHDNRAHQNPIKWNFLPLHQTDK